MKSKRIIALGTTLLMGITTMGAFGACGGTTVKNDGYGYGQSMGVPSTVCIPGKW